jgi:hypothetical protein
VILVEIADYRKKENKYKENNNNMMINKYHLQIVRCV